MSYNKRPALGQATMANSEPVVIASDQSTIPVSVSGVSTAANQSTLIGHVDSIETLIGTTNTTLTTIEADTSAIQTAVQLLDDTVQVLGTDTYTEATSKGITLGAVRRDANTSLVNTTNEFGPLQMNATGELKVVQVTAMPAGTNNIGDVDVLSIIPSTGATNLGKARDSAIGATDTGVAILGVRRDAPTAETPVAGDYVVPQVSANGEQWVGMAASATNSPAKARDGVAGASDTGIPTLMVRRDAPTAVTPAAADWEIPQISANGEQWVRLAGELADDAAFTVATTRVVPGGYLADETATDSVDEGDVGAARITLDRKQIVSTYAHTAGGATPYKLVSAATTNATSVKASAGNVYMITASNVNAAVRYLKLYNKASAPTVGTDVPVFTFAIPGNTAGAGTNIPVPTVGLNFSTGIALALTTEATDAGSTGVALSEIVVNLAYA